MTEVIVQQELKKLESNEKTVILHDFLNSQQALENQHVDNEELSEMLLDIIHIAFTSGFEIAINSVISSFDKKTIE